ncbi:MAG: Ig-like domain-containing protein, partial [Prevotellamassilia sp.]|nr:Ig-like domain-containing protein [Prevotellamassilia sp.]
SPSAVDATTITDDVITGTVEESMIWNFTSTGTVNQFYVQNEAGSYLYAIKDGAGVRVGTTSDKWTFAVNTTDYFSMQEATNNRYCAKYKDGSDWRSYTDANHDNYANGGKLELYKLVTAYTYSAYATNFAALSNRNLSFSETAVDYFEAPFTAPTLNGHSEGVTYASSDTEVATVNATTGEITIGTKYGTTTITASAEQSGSYYADEASYTISVWPNSISGLKTLITSESEIDFKVRLNNAVITYADEKNAYLQDADAAILIFIKEGHTMTAGQSYTGVASGKAKLYNGLREITAIDWGTIIPESAAVPAAAIVTLADLNANYDQYESMYVTVQNAIVTSALSSRNATISQDSEEYNVYDKNNGLSATALSTTNAIVKLYGFPGKFNTTLQLNVFNGVDVEETGYNLVVSAAGYATYFNSAKAFTMPIGATGYVWYDGKIEFAYDSAADVPANEPLVIKAAAGNYALWFTSSTEETYKSYGMNELEGTDVETAIPDDDAYFYGLSLNASHDPASVGFYWMNPTGAAFTNGAHKAYLKLAKNALAGSQAVKGFPFNGTTTGIEQIEAGADAKNAIYDLSGRRVNKAAKGIYILNGKKVLVK